VDWNGRKGREKGESLVCYHNYKEWHSVQLAKYPHIQLPGEGNTLQQEPKRDWHNQYEALPMEKSSLTSLTC